MLRLRRFGSGGLMTPPLILGGNVFGWTADAATSFSILDAFVAAGGRMIDTADVYSAWVQGNKGGESETIIGEWLAQRGRSEDVLIATKVGAQGGLSEQRQGKEATVSWDKVAAETGHTLGWLRPSPISWLRRRRRLGPIWMPRA
jgi:aryl-alcohol dehydrogenase-like predicted oxidoreductase